MSSANALGASSEKIKEKQGHPAGFWFFFWGEFAERCSYYGMRAILPLYLTTALHFGLDSSNKIYFGFKMACYFLPLVGGFLADRYFGKYWTIVGFSIPYILGHFVLGIENNLALFIALALLAGGSGVIKPNISTLMGQTYDQQRPGNERLRSSAFLWFYFSINVGAVISTFTLPSVRDEYGYATAFQIPAWLMVGSFIVFAAGKRFYAVETLDYRPKTPEERIQQRKTFMQLCGIFALMIFFWVAYEHNDSMWVFFSEDYINRSVPTWASIPTKLGITEDSSRWVRWMLNAPGVAKPFAPDQIQFLNPLFVLIFVPFFSWFFAKIDPTFRVFRPTRKILMGFAFTAASVGIVTAAAYQSRTTGMLVPMGWMVAAYVVLTAGEVLLYGTGLELAYAAAPKNMKGFVTACFLLTNTLGNLINLKYCDLYGGKLSDPIEKRGPLSPEAFFGLTGLIVVAATIAFYFVGKRFDRLQHQGEAS